MNIDQPVFGRNLSLVREEWARFSRSTAPHCAASEHHVASRRRASSVYHKRKAFGGDRTPAVDVDAFRSTFDSCYLWEITIEFVIVTSSLSFLGLFCRPFPNVWICNFMLESSWMHNIWALANSNLVNCTEAHTRKLTFTTGHKLEISFTKQKLEV